MNHMNTVHTMIFMTPKIGLIIVHGFMNATIKNYGYDQWLLTINVHGHIYEHTSCMINDHRYRYEHWSSWSMIKGKTYEHRSSIIINHKWHSSRSMIVAMKCRWSYMISVDQWVISWTLVNHSVSVSDFRHDFEKVKEAFKIMSENDQWGFCEFKCPLPTQKESDDCWPCDSGILWSLWNHIEVCHPLAYEWLW